jgi:hypothetical protein
MNRAPARAAEQAAAVLDELKPQTDRAVALISAAELDGLLQTLLLARFVDLGSEEKDSLFQRSRRAAIVIFIQS